MSAANVELVRSIYGAWAEGRSARAFIAEDVEYVNPHDGQAIRFRWFNDPAEALAAAGLQPQAGA